MKDFSASLDSWHCSDFVVAKVSRPVIETSIFFNYSSLFITKVTLISTFCKYKHTIAFAYLNYASSPSLISCFRYYIHKKRTQNNVNFTLFLIETLCLLNHIHWIVKLLLFITETFRICSRRYIIWHLLLLWHLTTVAQIVS